MSPISLFCSYLRTQENTSDLRCRVLHSNSPKKQKETYILVVSPIIGYSTAHHAQITPRAPERK